MAHGWDDVENPRRSIDRRGSHRRHGTHVADHRRDILGSQPASGIFTARARALIVHLDKTDLCPEQSSARLQQGSRPFVETMPSAIGSVADACAGIMLPNANSKGKPGASAWRNKARRKPKGRKLAPRPSVFRGETRHLTGTGSLSSARR